MLSYLRDNLLLYANYYEGDMLNSLLIIPKSFWQSSRKLYREVYELISENRDVLSKLKPNDPTDKKKPEL